MSTKKLWDKKWKKLKRKSDRDLNILIQEEYFENIAEKSAHYNLSKKYNAEQHSMQQKRNTNISVSNNQMSNNDYLNDHDHGSENDQFIAQEDIQKLQSSPTTSMECTDTVQTCRTFCVKKASLHEVEEALILTDISDCESENSYTHNEIDDRDEQDLQNENNQVTCLNDITVALDNTLCKQNANVQQLMNDCERVNSDIKLAQDLAAWAVRRNITLNALSHLLKILRKNNHEFLPKCAQTLLKTPRSTKLLIRELKGGGEFWYYGILSGLKTVLSEEVLETLSNVIEIDVFFDGFSPYNSIRRFLWPIAGCIAGRKDVFIVAIWCGETKHPQDLDAYLEDFINETLELMNGFHMNNKCYKLKIRNVIADAPARTWLKCVNQHGSKIACERCTVKGVWFNNRMTYSPHEEAPLRTDESVCQQAQKEYHKGISPLIVRLQLKPLSQFPLESFHLLYLGVMKRIISRLYCAKASRYKLPGNVVFEIDNLCNFLKPFFPSDFARRPRKLSDWKYYKGTEFRRLLLYDGFLIFRKFHREVYQNFLLFACAVRILVDPTLVKKYANDADKLLRMFIEHSYKIYEQTFIVYNVHHLIHIVADCLLHGSLEEFSAFKFESFLGHMKNLLHAPGKTLSQIVCRVMEKAATFRSSYCTRNEISFEQRHEMGPNLNFEGEQYKKIRTSNYMFHVHSNDAYGLIKSNEIIKILNIIKCNNGEIYVIGRKFKKRSDLFSYPFPSSCINIFIVSALGSLKKWCLNDIKQKVVLLPLPEKDGRGNWISSKNVCFPMPHSETEIEL